LLGLLASACSPLKIFDTVMPKDGGGRLTIRDAAFGQDPRQRLDVYVPKAMSDRPRPIIIFFYGGSWNSGTKSGYSFVGRALASHGLVVVIPDYRLVPQVHYPTFLDDMRQPSAGCATMQEILMVTLIGSCSRAIPPEPTTRRCWSSILIISDRTVKRCAALSDSPVPMTSCPSTAL